MQQAALRGQHQEQQQRALLLQLQQQQQQQQASRRILQGSVKRLCGICMTVW
jgi:hypothetical protein